MNALRYRVAAPSIRIVPWAARASRWPLPQQLLPVSTAVGGCRCCTLAIFRGKKIFLIRDSETPAGVSESPFHRWSREGAAAFAAPLSAKARRCGDTPSVIACGDATFPKGTAFGSGGKVFGIAQRRPLGGAGERSEPEGVAFGMAGKFPATPPLLKKPLWKIRRFSRGANIKIFFPLFMRKANAERIPNRFRQSTTMHKAPEGVSLGGFAML